MPETRTPVKHFLASASLAFAGLAIPVTDRLSYVRRVAPLAAQEASPAPAAR